MNQQAMYKIGYGLYVLTACEAGKDNGCVVNTVMQVTTTPNRVMVAVNKQNLTHDMIQNTGVFNVSALTTSVPFEVFKHFGFQSGKTVDKFEGYEDKSRSENGILYLTKDTNAYISCKVVSSMDLGTHTLFLADVTDADVLSEGESVTYAYYQQFIKPAPAPAKKKGYRCKICGYVYEGDELPEDFICPICKHGAADFEKIED
ncbi:flavin reductase [Anaeromicropila populeti]|uniref:NADH-FMN oxidoreductase RutF, flavin reductase (DIM6/NTAB) family n=1 Tax=Anaeromicropila populeti TaxID=37658 RepID=A0A1I6JWZ2_9FIRM|nr:flavin reductase [Anaeromicropila populeti]SFR83509.1 NADH-FMN oxidoreductase RutF, flavin reductase (DIM6/NTAB) family [Anaeromicropila populeti]